MYVIRHMFLNVEGCHCLQNRCLHTLRGPLNTRRIPALLELGSSLCLTRSCSGERISCSRKASPQMAADFGNFLMKCFGGFASQRIHHSQRVLDNLGSIRSRTTLQHCNAALHTRRGQASLWLSRCLLPQGCFAGTVNLHEPADADRSYVGGAAVPVSHIFRVCVLLQAGM